jgi:hypothetical protein
MAWRVDIVMVKEVRGGNRNFDRREFELRSLVGDEKCDLTILDVSF